jgi:hypothetical protein
MVGDVLSDEMDKEYLIILSTTVVVGYSLDSVFNYWMANCASVLRWLHAVGTALDNVEITWNSLFISRGFPCIFVFYCRE